MQKKKKKVGWLCLEKVYYRSIGLTAIIILNIIIIIVLTCRKLTSQVLRFTVQSYCMTTRTSVSCSFHSGWCMPCEWKWEDGNCAEVYQIVLVCNSKLHVGHAMSHLFCLRNVLSVHVSEILGYQYANSMNRQCSWWNN